jgi:hypothetical protein
MHEEGIRTYWASPVFVEPEKRSSQWLGKNIGNFGYNRAVSRRAIGSFRWGNDFRAIYLRESDSEADLRENLGKYATLRAYIEKAHLGKKDDPAVYYSNMQKKVKMSPDDPAAAWVNDDTKWKQLFEALKFAEGWIEGQTVKKDNVDTLSSKPEDAPLVAYYRTLLGVAAPVTPAASPASAPPATTAGREGPSAG